MEHRTAAAMETVRRLGATKAERALSVAFVGLGVVVLGAIGWVGAAATGAAVRFVTRTAAVVAFVEPVMEQNKAAREQVVARAAAQAQAAAANPAPAGGPAPNQTSVPPQ